MLVVAAALTLLTLTGSITPSILLLFTFLLAAGAAVSLPSAMSYAMELVPKSDAQHVITLGGISINIGFAVGPILGGLVVAAYGPWSVFMLNALSFVGLIIFHHRWHRLPNSGQLPPEHVIGAMRAALQICTPLHTHTWITCSGFGIFYWQQFADGIVTSSN